MMRHLLRRTAFRALSARIAPFSAFRSSPSRVTTFLLPPSKSTGYRRFHQARICLAEEESASKHAEAIPAAAEISNETVTNEPSAADQEGSGEESIAARDVADAAQHTSEHVEKPDSSLSETVTEQAQDLASSAASTAQSAVSSAGNIARSAVGREQETSSFQSRALRPGASTFRRPTPSTILYVGNLFFEVTAQDLQSEFSHYGEIINSRVVNDPQGLSRGFGYVEFATQEEADRAVRELDQTVLQGRRMAVQYHVQRESRGHGLNAPREPNPPSKTLFIGNMSYQMSDRDLNGLSIMPLSKSKRTR